MANYNTFAVVESRHGNLLMITSSARKAQKMLCVGRRIEVWCNNEKTAMATSKNRSKMLPFLDAEKAYIRAKQEKSTRRNTKKKLNREGK